jgi:hypothetical protein
LPNLIYARSLIGVLCLSLAIEASSTAYACVVMPSGPPLEELNKSSVVFTGVVSDVVKGTIDGDMDLNGVFFEVNRYWKSPASADYNRLVVFTGISGDVCGYEFEEGREYLIYASMNENFGTLYTGVGSRTQPIEDAQVDLSVLGEGREPTLELGWEKQIAKTTFKPAPTAEQTTSEITIIQITVVIGIASAGIVTFFTLKRRHLKGPDSNVRSV